jgi:hypothetical protein
MSITPEQESARAIRRAVFEKRMNHHARQICKLCARQDIDWRDADLKLWEAATSHAGVQDRLDKAIGGKDVKDEDVIAMAEKTKTAYSYDRYGNGEWANCTRWLYEQLNDWDKVETVLRSKWMRWASDDGNFTVTAIKDFVAAYTYKRSFPSDNYKDIHALYASHFTG